MALHLPAIAHEGGLAFTMADIGKIFDRTPLLADLSRLRISPPSSDEGHIVAMMEAVFAL